MDQYFTSMPYVLILVRNVCSYYVYVRSVVVIQLSTAKECHCIEYYSIWNLPIGDIDTFHTELKNAAMPSFVSL